MKPISLITFQPGVSFALAAALLFGASTPIAKVLLGVTEPVLLAGLLYLGSGCGLAIWWWLRFRFQDGGSQEASLKRTDLPWLVGAIFAGGIVGPALLMVGLAITPASSASLLLNLEGVFTAVVAWFVFKEHFDRHCPWDGRNNRWRPSSFLGWPARVRYALARFGHRGCVPSVGYR